MPLDLDIEGIALADIPAALTRLAAAQSALAARLMMAPAAAPSPAPTVDRMLTVEEVAERLRCSTKSIYRRAKGFPFARRNGVRGWIFSDQGLTKWLARQRV
jgi:hypothetical protein